MHVLTKLVARLLLAAPLTALAAQAAPIELPEAGARIRLSVLGATPQTGTLVSHATDVLVVGWPNGRRDTVSIGDLSTLDVSRGRRRHAMRGAVMGFAMGTVAGLLMKMSADDGASHARYQNYMSCVEGGSCDALDDSVTSTTMLVPAGIFVGTMTGALFGLIAREEWHPSVRDREEVRVGVTPMVRSRRIALALAARF